MEDSIKMQMDKGRVFTNLSFLNLLYTLFLFRHYNGDRDYPRGYQNGEHIPRSSYADRTYSLPRTAGQSQNHPGYYTQDRRQRHPQQRNGNKPTIPEQANGHGSGAGTDTPDFYFMPSQRKYSGEVVRVYVDYNKDPK